MASVASGPPSGWAIGPAPSSPIQVVERLHEALITTMKSSDELGYAGRYAALEPVLADSFDAGFMSQKSVGRHWKVLDDSARRRLMSAFWTYTVANYAGRFDGYTGEEFVSLGEEESSHGTRLVRTRLRVPEGEVVELDYRLRPVDGGWKVIDMYLDGTVSELALRRSQYSSLIRREGVEALIAALEAKVRDFAAGEVSSD